VPPSGVQRRTIPIVPIGSVRTRTIMRFDRRTWEDLPILPEEREWQPVLPALPADLDYLHAQLPANYEEAIRALAECDRLDECQHWAKKAEAMASYARQLKDTRLLNHAMRIKARAMRRCGELLREIPAVPGMRTDLEPQDGAVPRFTRTEAATGAGLSERQRKTALRVAEVPFGEFEEAVEHPTRPPTVTELAERGRKPRKAEAAVLDATQAAPSSVWSVAVDVLPPDVPGSQPPPADEPSPDPVPQPPTWSIQFRLALQADPVATMEELERQVRDHANALSPSERRRFVNAARLRFLRWWECEDTGE